MKLYLDMDGVIVDFMGTVRKYDPEMPEWAEDDRLWSIVKSIPNFWETLPWTADGRELWEYVKSFDPMILSAPSRNDVRSPSGKLVWIHENLGFNTHFMFTRASKKKLLARPDAVLVDDFKNNINEWNKSGGIGILHKSAKETIKELEKFSFT